MSAADIMDEYFTWLKKSTQTVSINEWLEITTPFLDRHNDHIQIYARHIDNSYEITDDGDTIRDLESSGMSLNGKTRQQITASILNGFGVRLSENSLTVKSDLASLPQKIHNLLQAVLSIGDLYLLNKPLVANLFKEDVEQFLRQHGVRFIPSLKLTGKSGIDQYFDFAIPSSEIRPERILQAISRPTTQSIELFILAWLDTLERRPMGSIAYGFLNDKENEVREDLKEALTSYDIKPVPWSKREVVVPELVN